MQKTKSGFTIVELLIVIVVIGILAAITIVAYNGIQQRGRDAQRKSDVANIAKAIELFYIDNGAFPSCAGSNSTTIGNGWCTTADSSWSMLVSQLVPKYMSALPKDPQSKLNVDPLSTANHEYSYFYDYSGYYCGPTGTTFIFVYNFEVASRQNDLYGTCNTTTYHILGPYAPSNYRVVKGG